ncbi:MAG: rod-binding protein [Pseudomonadota bacterium]|nr:rod-binding protein [Pseudomonadota bacterium]
MSLAPPTDIVLEVARAADPARAAAVTDRLKALARQGAGSPQDFASALNAVAAPTGVPPPPPAAPVSRAKTAATKLESVILSQFVQEMLPKDAQSVFGQGYAGDMWRSMLAERVADQMAASGRIGIASRLFANKALSSSAQLLAPDKGRGLNQAQVTETSANPLSAASGAEIERGGVLFARTPSI